VIFDVETTGFTKNDQIIEIAAVVMIRGRITGNMFHSFIQLNDGVAIDERAQEVHGISEIILQKCCNDELDEELSSTTDAVLKRFIRFVDNSALVAHNVAFDFRMLKQDLEFSDLQEFLSTGFVMPSKENSFCTMVCYKYYR
jgi:DNA polymerase III epsilon subunit-like protein